MAGEGVRVADVVSRIAQHRLPASLAVDFNLDARRRLACDGSAPSRETAPRAAIDDQGAVDASVEAMQARLDAGFDALQPSRCAARNPRGRG